MNVEDLQTAKEHRRYLSAIRFFRRMPLRTRLIMAFVILIISSASATILIGYTVLGSKIDELAKDTITLTTKLGSQLLEAKEEKIAFIARTVSGKIRPDSDMGLLATLAFKEIEMDFIAFSFDGKRMNVFSFDPEKKNQEKPLANSSGVDGSTFPPVLINSIKYVLSKKEPVIGFFAADSEKMKPFNPAREDGSLVFMIAISPLCSDKSDLDCMGVMENGFVMIGLILNNKTQLLTDIQTAIGGQYKDHLMVTLFHGGTRIASTKGSEAVGTKADEKVMEKVLIDGKQFSGVARVLNESFYASYLPIRDLDGRIIGMVGIGTQEDIYAEFRRKTITLFTSLIAAGMILGFIMTYLFSRWLVTPIAQLAEGISKVAAGDLNHKVRIESADELGKLAKSFNQMVKAIKERDHKLLEMTENKLTAVERQISTGRLAAGVAHEINNPLTAILSLSSLWLKHMSTEDPKREDLEIIVTETSRCREIVRNLLDFARERPTEKRIVDINRVIRDTLTLAKKYDSMEKIRVETKLSEMRLNVNGDPKLLQQVFTNLLLNAAESMEDGGDIKIATDEDSSGGFVQISVQDTGKGIRKEYLKRVFEPFFTTKTGGKGTGLGLSVSLGIIQKHEGTIEIESEDNKGTRVTVILPRLGEVQ